MRVMKMVVVFVMALSLVSMAGCGVSKSKYESILKEKIGLEEKVSSLEKAKEALKNEYENVLKEKMGLTAEIATMTSERAALKGEYDKILEEKISLKAAYDKLQAELRASRR